MAPHHPPNRGRTLTVVLAALVLVGGVNVAAYAATGGNFLLGKPNSATHTTTLKNSGPGAALSVKTRASSPPFKVSSSKKVTKLNADRVDGNDSSALLTPGASFVLDVPVTTSSVTWTFSSLPPGVYEASFTVFATSGSGDAVNCGFLHPDGTFSGATFGTQLGSSNSSANATAILDLRTESIAVNCFNSGGFAVSTADVGNVASSADFVLLSDGSFGNADPVVRPGPGARSFGH